MSDKMSITSLTENITNHPPGFYGYLYLAAIPLFAVIYTLPFVELKGIECYPWRILDGIYFSVVTITTLGYGDVSPVNWVAKLFTGAESLVGISLIGLFLNALSHQHGKITQADEKAAQELRELKNDINRFSAFNRLVEIQIKSYSKYAISVTTKIMDRNVSQPNEEFVFNDMQDMFKPTLRQEDSFASPAVNYYFLEYKSLYSVVEEAIKLGHLHRWESIETLSIEFLIQSKELDYGNHITNQPNVKLGQQTSSDFDMTLIEKHEGEVKYIPANAINPYVAMYFQIKCCLIFIKEYRRLALEIETVNKAE